MLLRVELKSAENLRILSQEFRKNDLGGFLLEQMINTHELRNFIDVFRKENEQSGVVRGVSSRKLLAIKLRRFERLQEISDKGVQIRPDQVGKVDRNLDRKRYALVAYARMVVFLRKYFDGLAGRGPEIPLVKSNSLLQDLVDICQGHQSHFLGATTPADHKDYLCFHSAKVAVLSIVCWNRNWRLK